MSGGHFDYKQYQLQYIADDIEQLIRGNLSEDEWGEIRGYSMATIKKFQEAEKLLRKCQLMVQRIDWLVSGDDSEEAFHSRWGDEIENA